MMQLTKTSVRGLNLYPDYQSASAADYFEMLLEQEQFEYEPYKDPAADQWNIGYGTKIASTVGMSRAAAKMHAQRLYRYDDSDNLEHIKDIYRDRAELDYEEEKRKVGDFMNAKKIPYNNIQLNVVANMSYAMGFDALTNSKTGFNKMFAAMKDGDHVAAAHEIINSQFALQTRDRAFQLWSLMRNSKPTMDIQHGPELAGKGTSTADQAPTLGVEGSVAGKGLP